MKISLNWIREFVEIPTKYSTKELAELLTLRTCEVEGYEEIDETFAGLEGVVVGEIIAFEKIPDTDKLHKATVNIGGAKPIQLIFGMMVEMKIGNRVPVAVAPTKLPTGIDVTAKKIRGVMTEGMLCLDQELGLKKDGVSIQYFPGVKPGTPVAQLLKERRLHMYDNIVVGKIVGLSKHPNADRLNVAQVNVGDKTVKIVCAGQNLEIGMSVAVALPGAHTMTDDGTTTSIRAAKIRGEESFGMICADEELGLPTITKQTHDVTIGNIKEIAAHFKMPVPKPGTPFGELLKSDESKTDILLEVDNKSLTHRPDLWGHYGMAREFAAFLGKKLKPFITKTPGTLTGKGAKIKVDVKDASIVKRFLSAVISGIKIEPSPEWMQKRLRFLGMRPINNIVDVTNYVMLELGYPSHAFDRRTVANDHFVVRFAKEGETITTLDHKKRTLSTEDILVTNGETALGLCGTMGGANSEIKDDTTEVILEVGNWNPVMIRKMSQRHGLRTDAATRFEKSLDPEVAGFAFHRCAELILEICKGSQFAGPITDYYPQRAVPGTVFLDTARAQSKIGAPISEKEMIAHLESLEFGVKKATPSGEPPRLAGGKQAKKGFLTVTVPTFRATKDVNIEDDVIEEIARMYGYEKIEPTLPSLPIRLPLPNKERVLKYKVREIFSLGLNYTETSRYSFYGTPEIEKTLLPGASHMMLENPLTSDQTHMRVSLLPNILTTLESNLTIQENLKLYEIGRTYIKTSDFFPREEKFICGIIAKKSYKKELFYEAMGDVNTFLEKFGIKNVRVDAAATPPPYAHPQKCAEFRLDVASLVKEVFAIAYEIHPQVLKNYGISAPCVAFEINFTKLAAIGSQEVSYKPIPKFPGIEIDLSVLVDRKTPVRTVLELIRKNAGPLLKKASLTDTFEDKSLGENKKSFTIRVALQSDDRTLTDEEMKQVETSIKTAITKAEFEIR